MALRHAAAAIADAVRAPAGGFFNVREQAPCRCRSTGTDANAPVVAAATRPDEPNQPTNHTSQPCSSR